MPVEKKNNSSEFSEWVPLGQNSPTSTYPSMTWQFEVKGTIRYYFGIPLTTCKVVKFHHAPPGVWVETLGRSSIKQKSHFGS